MYRRVNEQVRRKFNLQFGDFCIQRVHSGLWGILLRLKGGYF